MIRGLADWRRARRAQRCDKVMVVAHPDDEVLWGGGSLAAESGWVVLCLTNASTPDRRRRFLRAMRRLNAVGLIFDVPDRRSTEPTAEDRRQMAGIISPFIQSPRTTRVLTHSPDGETGHRIHCVISEEVAAVASDDQLHYFNFSPQVDMRRDAPETWERKKAALEDYFGSLDTAPGNDGLHVRLSVHERPVAARDYRRPNDLLKAVYGGSTVPAGSITKGVLEDG